MTKWCSQVWKVVLIKRNTHTDMWMYSRGKNKTVTFVSFWLSLYAFPGLAQIHLLKSSLKPLIDIYPPWGTRFISRFICTINLIVGNHAKKNLRNETDIIHVCMYVFNVPSCTFTHRFTYTGVCIPFDEHHLPDSWTSFCHFSVLHSSPSPLFLSPLSSSSYLSTPILLPLPHWHVHVHVNGARCRHTHLWQNMYIGKTNVLSSAQHQAAWH